MAVLVVAVGRVRDAGLRAACEDYARRARRYFPLTVHEVAEAGRKGPTPAAARRLEGERVAGRLPARVVTVACTRDGKALSSRLLAARLQRWLAGSRDVAFLIGGAFGLDETLRSAATLTLTLSPLTLPHELARVVLLEQLYRAGTILKREPYHKGPA